jgi:hypothetical protein
MGGYIGMSAVEVYKQAHKEYSDLKVQWRIKLDALLKKAAKEKFEERGWEIGKVYHYSNYIDRNVEVKLIGYDPVDSYPYYQLYIAKISDPYRTFFVNLSGNNWLDEIEEE